MITEDGKVTFNEQEQAEVNRLIGERFSREGIADLRDIAEALGAFGYSGTPAEIKAAVKQQADFYRQQAAEAAKQQELEELQQQARENGTSAALLAEIKQLKAELGEIKGERQAQKQAVEASQRQQARFVQEVKDFQKDEKYKGTDLDKLLKDEDFKDFYQSSNPNLSISQVYDKYVKYVGGAEAAAMAKFKANSERSTASGRQRGDAVGTAGLTAAQIELVDKWNRENPRMKMTYKQFAEKL